VGYTSHLPKGEEKEEEVNLYRLHRVLLSRCALHVKRLHFRTQVATSNHSDEEDLDRREDDISLAKLLDIMVVVSNSPDGPASNGEPEDEQHAEGVEGAELSPQVALGRSKLHSLVQDQACRDCSEDAELVHDNGRVAVRACFAPSSDQKTDARNDGSAVEDDRPEAAKVKTVPSLGHSRGFRERTISFLDIRRVIGRGCR
jgi:hypothetical protein